LEPARVDRSATKLAASATPAGPTRPHQPPTAFIRRILCACSRRVGDGDVEALDLMLGLAEGIDTAIAEARHGPAHLRLFWAELGSPLGVTRQAAQQR
jgi:hypothetical protein